MTFRMRTYVRMAELCRQRVPLGRFRAHDLADPLDWLSDQSVDLVLFALALEYVDDRTQALGELRRVLRPDGALMLSRQHPTGDWLRHGGTTSIYGLSMKSGAAAGGFGTGSPHLSRHAKNCTKPVPHRATTRTAPYR